MQVAARWIKIVQIMVLAVLVTIFAVPAVAADLPLAAASPLTGVAFDDRPLLLPVQRNFQMAMLTAGSELGRSCGKMEAYGWRMSQTEQARVNQIFNNTVDRMRMSGYTIAPQKLTSVSNDITLFTADKSDKHFIFLWSAGELGLVMTLCQTTAPTNAPSHNALVPTESVQVFPVPDDVVSSRLDTLGGAGGRISSAPFTPLGEWQGGYTCAQGYTGGTLKITRLKGMDFEGEFKFYPTEKNRAVPPGSYTVYGQYDADSKRILINPGKWIQRPKNYYNTVIVGDFDPAHETFSAYFQGISGCTSFEAKHTSAPYIEHAIKKAKKIVKKPAKKKVVKKAAPPAPPINPAPVTVVPGAAPTLPPADSPPKPPAPTTPAPASQNNAAPPSTVPVGSTVTLPVIPSAPPALPAEDKAPVGITLSAPTR